MDSSKIVWFQKTIHLQSRSQGCYIVTDEVMKVIGSDIKKIKTGMVNLFLQHTSAAWTINESYDPLVLKDLNTTFNRIVPEGNHLYVHTDEGPDDAPSHIKCAWIGPSINIPIVNGELGLGTWQGIILCELRTAHKNRNIIATLNGVQN